MNFWIVFIAGLLIGWLVEWIIDWFYWRRPAQQAEANLAVIEPPTQKIRYSSKPAHADDLTKIKGVGPVIAKRLNKSGIYTFDQLGDLTLDEFEEALGDLLQKFINERAIIRHARQLADEKKEKQAA